MGESPDNNNTHLACTIQKAYRDLHIVPVDGAGLNDIDLLEGCLKAQVVFIMIQRRQ